jgi:acyl carrier protein
MAGVIHGERAAQSDEEFVGQCPLPEAPFAVPLALAVRREVARRAGVAPVAVWASDRLPEEWGDLFIRESLDAAEFVMQIEEEFGVEIPDWAGAIFSRESVSVADLASDLCGAALRRGRPGERPRSWGEVAAGVWAWMRARGHGAA